MGEQGEEKNHRNICVGLLAHVDAGKTTLSEAMLYEAGAIRALGRVDHRDAFLDTDTQERARGITIFSKQARLTWKGREITLLDTPGHVDFSSETERVLGVLDAAVLVVSATDGVQSHTRTLWRLLERYGIPVFLFVNKMDLPGADAGALMERLGRELSDGCQDFSAAHDGAWMENIAVCHEKLLDCYMSQGRLTDEMIAEHVRGRDIFPCFFGAALKNEGVGALLDGLVGYLPEPVYGEAFGARIFKITRDASGTRLTWVKLTGGSLRVKGVLDTGGTEPEKVNQIRFYSGEKYETKDEAKAGDVCALAGLAHTAAGGVLGAAGTQAKPVLAPVMTYRLLLPEGSDAFAVFGKLQQLQEEDPSLHVVWNERAGEIHMQLMGEVQTEVLKTLIRERFGEDVDFAEGHIIYRETVAEMVEGVGHFEPLRHYAEVHLLIEPGERGSGIELRSACREDVLDKNWQRLIFTHIREREHPGVLTGSALADVRISLLTGRAHLKHTEGGDFRQATYRALRQGLCKARSVLLEPVYAFRIELPVAFVGRAMTDLQAMSGRFEAPETAGEYAVLSGTVPVSEFGGYQTKLLSYTAGKGKLFTEMKGYEPCHNAEEIIEQIGYEAERDTENPCGSVFCAHGAGVVVPWDRVEEYMHLEAALKSGFRLSDGSIYGADTKNDLNGQLYRPGANGQGSGAGGESFAERYARRSTAGSSTVDFIGQDEVEEIFQRTYGSKERKKQGWARTIRREERAEAEVEYRGTEGRREEYLLVDGYNIIFAWEELSELAKLDLNAARCRLMDTLCNFQAYRKMHLILVFDAYRVKGNPGSVERYHNIDVVYTKEAETADQYIEKVTREMNRKKNLVRVATSDGLEQIIIMGAGAIRVSAAELYAEIRMAEEEMREDYGISVD